MSTYYLYQNCKRGPTYRYRRFEKTNKTVTWMNMGTRLCDLASERRKSCRSVTQRISNILGVSNSPTKL